MSNMSKACDISPKVRRRVYARDDKTCILCGNPRFIELAHYIPRSQGGLGIEENLVCLCVYCHRKYDNGDMREEFGADIKGYLRAVYKKWNEKDLVYDKYRWVDEINSTA